MRVTSRVGAAIAALVLVLSGSALAADTGNVVPRTGMVAGHGYAYWLTRTWQVILATAPPMKPCETLIANNDRVGYLTVERIAPGTFNYTCTEPAGRPLWVAEASNECSTFAGDHGTFGTSDEQLRRCARELFAGIHETTTVDGRGVNLEDLIIGPTDVFAVHIPENNILGDPPGDGRSSAYGFGLLLRGFEPGTHVIHTVTTIGTLTAEVTFTVLVH